ncbi:MAG: carbohydrate ABC transporter substrate-binding protein [Spirochaetia bacterium]|nr:carbohydrate ABC transporter substrate-binding protein [Spirochaetia bacterium]
MRQLFLWILAALVVFSQAMTWKSLQRGGNGGLSIYWVTDGNPLRGEQVALFKAWLKKRGYPDVALKLDLNNGGLQKTIVQGVSGTAGDCIDILSQYLGYLDQMGLVTPVTDLEKTFGYPDRDLFPPLSNYIFAKGKQIGFPCSITITGLLVNEDAFRSLGLEPPPYLMDFDSFERVGSTYLARARQKNQGPVFFIGAFNQEVMRRSVGVSALNETMTAPALDRPEYVEVLKRISRWTFDLHLAPSSSELSSFVTEDGYGGLMPQLLDTGKVALIEAGRNLMILMRQMKVQHHWNVVLHPCGDYPNTIATTRAVVLYKGSPNHEAAKYFLGFLRSDEYSAQMVSQSDAIPPNPRFMDGEEFLNPRGHENEWPMHAGYRRMALEHAVPREISPYALYQNYARAETKAWQGFTSHIHSAEETVRQLHRSLAEEISSFLKSHPEVRPAYEAALETQKQIDALKLKGKKIPLDLVDNPFLKRYYRDKGLGI